MSLTNTSPNKVLVVVAHADDEVIGCGGTLAKHRDAGDEIRIIFMTNGVGARDQHGENSEQVQARLEAQKQVCQQLKVTHFYNHDFPDNQMDQVPLIKVAQTIEAFLAEYEASVIYTHHGGDLNVDHCIVHQAVLTACRPQPGSSVKTILTFEVNSSTEWASPTMSDPFIPNYFVEISQYQHEKKQLLCHYQDEIKAYPHSRSFEGISHLNKFRGNSVGLNAAEAFMLIRKIS